MKGIVVAAGRGLRLRPYTEATPKCMLVVNGRPLMHYTLAALRAAGCRDIVVVTGHLADRVDAPGCRVVRNTDYENNNILHSVMYARDELDDDVLVTYSDIVVEPDVHARLAAERGDIVIAADVDWQGYYEGRTRHPLSEAEKVRLVVTETGRGSVACMGKHLPVTTEVGEVCAEFLGLWKMTAAGALKFRHHFEMLDARLSPLAPFQHAAEWRKAYVTDLLTDFVESGGAVEALLIQRGWAELDTVEDYERLPGVAARQGLRSLEHPA